MHTKIRFASEASLALAIGQQLAAGLILIPFSVTSVERVQNVTLPIAFSVLCLALFSTSIGYLIYFYLIKSVGPTKTLR